MIHIKHQTKQGLYTLGGRSGRLDVCVGWTFTFYFMLLEF